jgi:hypothetical protein
VPVEKVADEAKDLFLGPHDFIVPYQCMTGKGRIRECPSEHETDRTIVYIFKFASKTPRGPLGFQCTILGSDPLVF